MAKVKFNLGLRLSFALALWFLRVHAPAHTLPISYLFIVTDVDYVHVELTFNPFELMSFSEFDTNKNARLDPAEVASQGDRIARLLLDQLTLTVDGKKIESETAGISPDANSHHATLRVHYRVKARDAEVSLESNLSQVTSRSHFTQVNFLRGGQRQLAQLDAQSRKATFRPSAPKQPAVKPSEISKTKKNQEP
ncbi:MAG: hypothetical protein IH623_13975 [Verrucomicrobia bacterium]|nr:hypothetical protein [Verrucomicrobiota bacterium]